MLYRIVIEPDEDGQFVSRLAPGSARVEWRLNFTDSFKSFPQLTTKRLMLRKLASSDAGKYFAMASVLPIERWGSLDRKSEEKAAMMIALCNKKFEKREYIRWGICLRPKLGLVGMCELFEFRNQGRAEIGYWLGTDYWGNGLMVEAIQAAVQYGFNAVGLHRIEAFTASDNIQSIRMLDKAGFVNEGLLKKHTQRGGVWTDSVVMANVK